MCPGSFQGLLLGSDYVTFNEIRRDIELIFGQYRKHKYYTLFSNNYNTSITSTIDEVGGGRSNKTSDKVADAAVRIADKKIEAEEFVEIVENAVNSLPDLEKQLIELRYMSRDHDYINDYTVYEVKMFISAPYYDKLRKRAFNRLYLMLSDVV